MLTDYDEVLDFFIKNLPAGVEDITVAQSPVKWQCLHSASRNWPLSPTDRPSEVAWRYTVENTGSTGTPPESCWNHPTYGTAVIAFSEGDYDHGRDFGHASIYIYKNGSTHTISCTGGVGVTCSTWSYDQVTITFP